MTNVYSGGKYFRRLYERKILPMDPPATTRSGLKSGDSVVISRRPTDEEAATWRDAWIHHMDRSVGSIGKVTYVAGPDSVCIEFDDATKMDGFHYPEFCVKLIDD
jgi:hypothetical protein